MSGMEGGYRPNPKEEGVSRRDFLKMGGAFVAGTVLGGLGGKEILKNSEKNSEEIIGRILLKSDKVEKNVEAGRNIDSFYNESGWQEYDIHYFEEAVKELNPELKERSPRENENILIPIKKGE